jgi:hypothetical protein
MVESNIDSLSFGLPIRIFYLLLQKLYDLFNDRVKHLSQVVAVDISLARSS